MIDVTIKEPDKGDECIGYYITINGFKHLVTEAYSDSLCELLRDEFIFEPSDEIYGLDRETALNHKAFFGKAISVAYIEPLYLFDEVEPDHDVEWTRKKLNKPFMAKFGFGDGGYHYFEKEFLIEMIDESPEAVITFNLDFDLVGYVDSDTDEDYFYTAASDADIIRFGNDYITNTLKPTGLNWSFSNDRFRGWCITASTTDSELINLNHNRKSMETFIDSVIEDFNQQCYEACICYNNFIDMVNDNLIYFNVPNTHDDPYRDKLFVDNVLNKLTCGKWILNDDENRFELHLTVDELLIDRLTGRDYQSEGFGKDLYERYERYNWASIEELQGETE